MKMFQAGKWFLLVNLLFALAASVVSALGTDGLYATTDNNYRTEVRFEPGKLIVVEPNKTSTYTQQDGTPVYLFRNPTNGIEYLIEVMADGKSLKAYKPASPQNFTLLNLVKASAAPQSAGSCTAAEIPVQNVQAINPNRERMWGVRAIPGANVHGTYLNEGVGSPVIELRAEGSGKFEMFGAPKPDHVYEIEWWLQANCDGTLVANDYPTATRYSLIIEYKDKPYQLKWFDRIGLVVQKAPDGKMSIFERTKLK